MVRHVVRCVVLSLVMALLPMPLLMIVWDAEAQSRNTPAQLLPTRSISLKTCGWEPTPHEPFGMKPTGYVPLIMAFDHQGNLWTGYTTKVTQLVPRAKPESGAQYNIMELSGSPVKCNNRSDDNARSIAVYDQDGSLIHVVSAQDREVKENGWDSGWGTVSEDGSRVAVVIDTMAGGMPSLDIGDHIGSRRVDIFDTGTWTRTAQIELPVTGKTELTSGTTAIAFTPDGKTLAIRMADLVQFYDGIP